MSVGALNSFNYARFQDTDEDHWCRTKCWDGMGRVRDISCSYRATSESILIMEISGESMKRLIFTVNFCPMCGLDGRVTRQT